MASRNYFSQPRDNQRQRLYDAEKALEGLRVSVSARRHLVDTKTKPGWYTGLPSFEEGKRALAEGRPIPKPTPLRYPSIEACKAYVDDIEGRAWFRNRWGRHHFCVEAGSGSHAGHGVITLSAIHRRSEAVILHEMAHCLINPYRHAWHGPEFAGVLLTLVRYSMGKDHADTLRASYGLHRVRYNLDAAQIQEGSGHAALR